VQYVEFMLEVLPSKTTKAKPWRLSVRREQLCRDVIGHFGCHEGERCGFTKQKLFQRTSVIFADANDEQEEGNDLGGLTVEMYSSFFRELLLRDLGLFEGVADDAGGGSSIGLLPKPDAPAAALEAVGRAICKCAACAPKALRSSQVSYTVSHGSCRCASARRAPVRRCVLDDQPIGSGLGCFLFEYLADAHERRAHPVLEPPCTPSHSVTLLHPHPYTLTGASSVRRTPRSRRSRTSTPSLRSGGPSCSPSRRRG
jgi:hypothetical protein